MFSHSFIPIFAYLLTALAAGAVIGSEKPQQRHVAPQPAVQEVEDEHRSINTGGGTLVIKIPRISTENLQNLFQPKTTTRRPDSSEDYDDDHHHHQHRPHRPHRPPTRRPRPTRKTTPKPTPSTNTTTTRKPHRPCRPHKPGEDTDCDEWEDDEHETPMRPPWFHRQPSYEWPLYPPYFYPPYFFPTFYYGQPPHTQRQDEQADLVSMQPVPNTDAPEYISTETSDSVGFTANSAATSDPS